MKVALYKGTRPGAAGLYNRAIRAVTGQQYSHVELVFSDGMSGSSSFMDGGVRLKPINYTTQANWDFIDLPEGRFNEAAAREWFHVHARQGYDLPGAFHFFLALFPDDPNLWFCNEAVGASLGIEHPAMYHPGTFAALVRSMA
ncbi:MAG: hypothetical protein RL758_270 [Pseudomonadota bacterium]|jgi:hypothetical protein